MKHDLKILPQYFKAVYNRVKQFEVRNNDRNFAVGDDLILKEWEPEIGYTGAICFRKVTYILDDQTYLKKGYVVLGLD